MAMTSKPTPPNKAGKKLGKQLVERKVVKAAKKVVSNSTPAGLKAASKMTPREAAARKIGSESLARRQSENTTGMWSNDKPRGQKVPKTPKYKDPTKTKGFAYGKKTQ